MLAQPRPLQSSGWPAACLRSPRCLRGPRPWPTPMQQHPPSGSRRAVVSNAAMCKPLTNFWSTLIAEQLLEHAPGLTPKASYLVSHGVGHLLIPLLEALLLVALMRRLAAVATAWCEANPDRPFSTEVIGLLPAALKGPTVVTVFLMLTVRLLRNAAYLAANLMHMADRTSCGKAFGKLVDDLADFLSPLDRVVVKIYLVLTLLFLGTVMANWKSIGFTFLLERERERQESALVAAQGGDAAGRRGGARSMDELERLVVPLDAASNWLIYMMVAVGCAQVLGLNIAPLVAVGGAGSIILGLATQQLLTNAVMGLSLFFTRPFVNGDSVLVQGGGNMVSGVVENTTVMRTTLRTDDDVVVTIPNKVVADMVVYNRSVDITRSRLAKFNRQTENVKLRLKLPYVAEGRLRELQEAVKATLEPPPGSSSGSSGGSTPQASVWGEDGSRPGSQPGSRQASRPGSPAGAGAAAQPRPPAAAPAGHPIVSKSVEVVLSKFTDSGMELLVKARLRAEPSNPQVQALLLELSRRVRDLGAVMVNL